MPCRELRFVLSVVFYVVNENSQNRIRSKSCKKKKENTQNPKISGVVLELLGRFELPTSSLPKSRGCFYGVPIHAEKEPPIPCAARDWRFSLF